MLLASFFASTKPGRATLAALIALTLSSGAAFAQEAEEAAPEEAAAPRGIEEITVTVTKRDETLQDVPASITAMSPEQIQEANIQRTADLAILIPNVITKASREANAITVRGISLGFDSIAGSVAQHINGVFYGNETAPGAMLNSWYDLDGVEFLRGPSGVTYGRNGTAGAMNLKWRDPHASYEAFADFGVGNMSMREARAGLNIPFFGEGNEILTGRFVATHLQHDGPVDSPHLPDDEDGGAADDYHFRGILRSQVNENFSITARGHYSTTDSNSSLAVPGAFHDDYVRSGFLGGSLPWDPFYGYTLFDAAARGASGPGTPTYNGTRAAVLAGSGLTEDSFSMLPMANQDALNTVISNAAYGGFLGIFGLSPSDIGRPNAPFPDGDRDSNTNNVLQHGDARIRIHGWNGEVEWNLGEFGILGDLTLNIIGGYSDFQEDQRPESDGSIYRVLDTVSDITASHTTFEFRLSSDSEGPVDWILGYFWFDSDLNNNPQFYRIDSTHPDAHGTRASPSGFDGATGKCHGTWLSPGWCSGRGPFWESSGVAPFASVNYRPFEPLEFFGGVRHNTDEHDDLETQAIEGISVKNEFSETTGEIGFRWYFADDQMFFLKWSRGYKPGYSRFDNDLQAPYDINPEIVDAWEVGLRSSLFDRRLNLSLNAFSYDYTELQVQKLVGLQVRTENAGEAEIWGLEAELDFQPIDQWRTQFSIGYLDTEISDYCSLDELWVNSNHPGGIPWLGALRATGDPFITDVGVDPGCEADLAPGYSNISPLRNLEGNDLEDSPNLKIALRTSYRWDLGDRGSLTGVITSSWTDDYYLDPFNREIGKVDAYTRSDARVIWRDADERWWAEAFVDNIEDDTRYLRLIVTALVRQPAGYGLTRPRFYGVRVGFNWGGE